MLKSKSQSIDRILIVDDEPLAREAFTLVIEDMELTPKEIDRFPGPDIQSFVTTIQPNDAILCDYHLKKRSYAPCNGDEILRQCYRAGVPGVLVTSIDPVPIRRDCLRFIPRVLRTTVLDPSSLKHALEQSGQELAGNIQSSRKPWRTLVRVDDVDEDHECFYAVVPAWSVRIRVPIYIDYLPANVAKLVEPGRRFHALVNTGAEEARDLYFDEWETQ